MKIQVLILNRVQVPINDTKHCFMFVLLVDRCSITQTLGKVSHACAHQSKIQTSASVDVICTPKTFTQRVILST